MKLAKIPPSDLRVLLALLPRLEAGEKEARSQLIERRADFFASDCKSPSWSHLYELPIKQHIAKVFENLGQSEMLIKVAKAPRQLQMAATVIDELDQDESELSPEEKEELRPRMGAILGLVISVIRSLHCLMAYGVYLNDLVAQVRQGGPKGDQALFKAVRIDPTTITAPSLNSRFSRAVLEDDQAFIKSVKGAINGSLSKQRQANADLIRLILQVLQEVGVERLSDDELHDLFVKELNLYAATAKADAGDPANGIKAIRDRMKKAKATT
jgi:hypothetical protein